MKFETLDSKIAEGIMKVIPADFKRKINFSEETHNKNKCPILTGRQITCQMFSFLHVNKTQEHTMNLSNLVIVELYIDNPKMFNQAWKETVLARGNDLDEGVLENLCERQVRTSTLMQNALTLSQPDIVLKDEPRSDKRLMTVVHDILEQQWQNMLICQKER